MGDFQVRTILEDADKAVFIRHLLDDVQALEEMLQRDLFEKAPIRIGAEQELCLVNSGWTPSDQAENILAAINDPHFTTELARYNLEINLDPRELGGTCFSGLHQQLSHLLQKGADIARQYGAKIILTGILPTISKAELSMDYLTPIPRYLALNEIITRLRKCDFELHLRGTDELTIRHDSVMFEGCNTSFQLHLQVPPDDFVSAYNWAQVISAPVLAVSTNSPLLLGRELWSETRIALFQQSLDTRTCSYYLRDQEPRVTFGHDWVHQSITELFRDDIARFRILLSADIPQSSLDELKQGKMPRLKALTLHNGTIYRWNRPCYGVGGGKPHLRIECRYLPAGPSVLDEVANMAFWVGLMQGRPAGFDHLPEQMDFRDVRANFIKAARTGKATQLLWRGEMRPAAELVRNELLPLAYAGLRKAAVDPEDIETYLRVIEQRTAGTDGSRWLTRNYRSLSTGHRDEALLRLTEALYENQQSGKPVHEWTDADATQPSGPYPQQWVRQIMSTRLFTVNENDLADLATSIMQWKNIHHVPVENDAGELVGLLSWSHLQNFDRTRPENERIIVRDIMVRNLHTVGPDTSTAEAVTRMNTQGIGCLPVVSDNQLIGIITRQDINRVHHGKSIQ